MVAKITVPASIKKALNYNEQKMKQGTAECIYAQNFLKEAEQLNFYEKLNRFENLIALNSRAATNTVHISLNFAPGEKMGKEKLAEIATVYMSKIGFGDQPFLVYQHHDAGHPHIHIVTTNIQKSGKRISLHNLGRNESTKARKEIEVTYQLVKAEDERKQTSEIKTMNVQRVIYGKAATKTGITNVLSAVLPDYKYASLAELNAVLKLYNITADRGREDGIIFNKRGLVYRVLDANGNKIGAPIKASSLYNRPTLAYLEKKFKENEIAKQPYKRNLKTAIDWVLVKSPKSLGEFKEALEKEKINLIKRENENGIIYGLTYVDRNTKCVFNGSDIGKDYSARSILEKCKVPQVLLMPQKGSETNLVPDIHTDLSSEVLGQQLTDISGIADAIIDPSDEVHYLPYELRRPRKKRRKKS